MAKKKKTASVELVEAEITRQPITETLEKNYMPYVVTVIVSRAIPEIDGFKPSQRKLLYCMYRMGLMSGPRKKSATVVGETMKLNPHGDAAIYETMVRLTRGHEALLHPFVDSKGAFGKQFSRDMAFAAPRYTEVRLDQFCHELFAGIDKDSVDFIPNYDNTMMEPTLFPTTYPNILISPNLGIAVGMTSNICSFNLAEICDGTIAMLKKPSIGVDEMLDIIKAPDFSTGAFVVYDREQLKKIYQTGMGGVTLRARYAYDKKENCIDILEIPYTACVETIIKKIQDMMRDGKLKGVVDVRDAIDLDGGRLITIDLKRDTDPDKLMKKLYQATDLEKSFDCNFNVLIDSVPMTLGVLDILREWIRFRMTTYKRELAYDLKKKQDKLHLLLGLAAIFLDIDKAIRIIRNTQKESEVVKNLMEAFSLTQIQAEYIAEIKLRHLNREYIVNRISEIETLQQDIANLEEILRDDIKVKREIAKQLAEIKKKYGKPRRTLLVTNDAEEFVEEEEEVENYPVHVFLTKEGYFKKITPQSMKANDEQKLKEDDEIIYSAETDNRAFLCVFSNQAKMYRIAVAEFDTMKASVLGDYLPAKLGMDQDEYPVGGVVLHQYVEGHNFGFVFDNGKAVKTPVTAYETKVKRKKLVQAYSSAATCVGFFYEPGKAVDVLLVSKNKKGVLVSSALITQKQTRGAMGSTVFELKRGDSVVYASSQFEGKYPKAPDECRKRKIPAAGNPL